MFEKNKKSVSLLLHLHLYSHLTIIILWLLKLQPFIYQALHPLLFDHQEVANLQPSWWTPHLHHQPHPIHICCWFEMAYKFVLQPRQSPSINIVNTSHFTLAAPASIMVSLLLQFIKVTVAESSGFYLSFLDSPHSMTESDRCHSFFPFLTDKYHVSFSVQNHYFICHEKWISFELHNKTDWNVWILIWYFVNYVVMWKLQVLVPKEPELLGKTVTVKIVSASKHSMNGELLSQESLPYRDYKEIVEIPKQVASSSTSLFSYTLSVIILAVIARLIWLFYEKYFTE